MAFKIINQKNEKATFILEGTPAFANSMRRSIIEEVPTMAIEDVEIRENSSALYDEMIALRLGLMPLKTDLKSYILPADCKCKGEGCNRCQLKLTLKAQGPCVVYASEIKTKDAKIKPVFPKMQIIKLLKGQKIQLEATAILGKGKEHAKWCPGLAFYKHLPIIDMGNGNKEDFEAGVKTCPLDLLEMKGNKAAVKKDKLYDCHLCESCQDASKGAIKISHEPNKFIFTIESWGQLTPNEIATTAADMITEKADELQTLLKK